MSMQDRTNESIPLTLHYMVIDGVVHPGVLTVDVDSDSSLRPMIWVDMSLTDVNHDADRIILDFHEARLLYDRLGLILGRS